MRGKPQEGDAKFSVQSSRVAGGIMLVLRGELDLRTASDCRGGTGGRRAISRTRRA